MFYEKTFVDLKNLSPAQLRRILTVTPSSNYTLVDVRSRREYEGSSIPGAISIPISELDARLGEMNFAKPMIVYCAVGYRSRAAVRYLEGKGFQKVYNLRGGIGAWDGGSAVGPPDMGLSRTRGGLTPHETVMLAYGLEEAMFQFYEQLGKKVGNGEVGKLLVKLAEFEDLHKDRLFGLNLHLASEPEDRETFARKASSGTQGRGYSAEEFMETHQVRLESVEGLLDVALSLEAQAFDFYLGLAKELQDPEASATIRALADDEKKHLAALGDMMEKIS